MSRYLVCRHCTALRRKSSVQMSRMVILDYLIVDLQLVPDGDPLR